MRVRGGERKWVQPLRGCTEFNPVMWYYMLTGKEE
jgi:hypothetical protein